MEKQLTLMIIDDDEYDRQWIIQAAESTMSAIRFVEAGDGRDAMEHLLNGLKPDLIFLDLNMPRMDGFEFLRSLNYKPGVKKIPVVAVSTSDRIADVSKAISLGAIHYIVKTYSYPELAKKIGEVLTGFMSAQTTA